MPRVTIKSLQNELARRDDADKRRRRQAEDQLIRVIKAWNPVIGQEIEAVIHRYRWHQ